MSCLDEIIDGSRVIIGVKDFTECETPESRLYINDLPGMSLKNAAAVADPEKYKSGAELLRNCTIMAARHVFDEFSTELQPYFNFSNIIESRDINVFTIDKNLPVDTERGLIIRRWRSEAARLFVENVYIKVNQPGTVTLKIIDGALTTQIEIELEEGLNTIRLDYKAEQEEIKIVFNQAEFETFECSYNKGGCSSCGSKNKNIYVTGWDGEKETNKCYGMGIKVHMQCYEENILCSLLPKMYFLLWYKSGIIALKERIATDRINHIATFGKERAEALLEDYEQAYKEKYALLVKGAYSFLKSTKGECVKCNSTKYVQATP